MTYTQNLNLPQFVGTDPVQYTDFNAAFASLDTVSFVGEIRMWPVSTPPANFLICDGSSISKTAAPKLYALIGETFGAGNDTTEFRIPNFCSTVPVGVDTSNPNLNTAGDTYGENEHTLTIAEMPSHTHQMAGCIENGSGSASAIARVTAYGSSLQQTTYGNAVATGGGSAHNNMQQSLAIYFIIRYQ